MLFTVRTSKVSTHKGQVGQCVCMYRVDISVAIHAVEMPVSKDLSQNSDVCQYRFLLYRAEFMLS